MLLPAAAPARAVVVGITSAAGPGEEAPGAPPGPKDKAPRKISVAGGITLRQPRAKGALKAPLKVGANKPGRGVGL